MWDELLEKVKQMEPMEHWRVSQRFEADFWEGFIKEHNYTREQWSRFKYSRLRSALSGFPFSVRGLVGGAGRILDLGCGAWSVVESMPGQVVAIDPNLENYVALQPDVLALGQVDNVDYRSCRVQNVPEENFDVVWSHNVLDHTGDWREIIGECTRVLAPGGSLLIGTNVIYGLVSKRRRVTHPSKFTAEQLLKVLRQNSFEIKWHGDLWRKRRWFFQVWAENGK